MKRFVFVHIPRCAGTSFVHELKQQYGPLVFHDKSFRNYRHPNGLILCDRVAENINYMRVYRFNPTYHRVVFGHFSIDKYWGLGWHNVTFLREPVKRVLSYYNVFLKENPRCRLRDFVRMHSDFIFKMTGGDLSRFDFVGISEYMNESLKRLREKLEFNIPVPMIKLNHHNRPFSYKPTDYDIKLIKEHNQQDIRIYEKAVQAFC